MLKICPELEICPEFQSEHPTDSVLCSKCKTQTSKKMWHSWATSNFLCPDDIHVELASLSSDEVRVIPSNWHKTIFMVW